MKVSQNRTSECPSEECWPHLAAGLPDEDGAAALAHAASCGYCSQLLNSALVCLRDDPTEEERAFLERLASEPRDISRRLHLESQPPPVPSRKPPAYWIWAVAACVVAAFVGGWWVHRRSPAAPLPLLANAYAEQRSMDLRIAAAAFAPKVLVRGPAGRSAALLEAEAVLDRDFAQHANDGPWLHARGLADLLAGRSATAVDNLLRASQIRPDSADILIDLAVALAQKGVSEGRPQDLESAEATVNRVLALRPENPAACFNRALIREDRQEWKLAEQDWQRYLKLDPHGGWAREAREHLERMQNVRR
jgi:tetratricopeptide (TPR) repeat protein